MSVRTAPCEWPITYAGCTAEQPIPEPLSSMPASGVEVYENLAREYLWRWTGMALGVCEATIRLCRENCTEGVSSFYGSGPTVGPFGLRGPWTPVLIDGLWFNIGCGRCGDHCGCGGESPLKLPGPIDSIGVVKEDGQVLDPSAYHVENNEWLIRTDGRSWSPCGLEITYDRGTAVPEGGRVAAGVLAVELALAACNSSECRLPKRVQTVTRQGVTIAMLDAFDDVDKGHTGIWIIDSWLASMSNPTPASRVLSPDLPKRPVRQKTWP